MAFQKGHKPAQTGRGRGVRWLRSHKRQTGKECLIWPFSRIPKGYGTFGLDGKLLYAHRYMCELVNGPPPTPKHQARHSCGNGHLGCVHPRHLSWGTNSMNQNDRRKHGTFTNSGIGNRSRLTAEQIAEIRAKKGIETQASLAKRFGVSLGCIEYWHGPKSRIIPNARAA